MSTMQLHTIETCLQSILDTLLVLLLGQFDVFKSHLLWNGIKHPGHVSDRLSSSNG